MKLGMQPKVEIFSDPETNNSTYLVRDPSSRACAVIDSLQSYDLFSGRFSTTPAQNVIEFIHIFIFIVVHKYNLNVLHCNLKYF